MSWLPPRLRPLLGTDPDGVDLVAIEKLLGLPEDRDLEFKRDAYGTSDGQVKEAAYDIAALANAGGGLLVIGVEEDGAGVASAITAVAPLGHDFGLWIHQVVAGRVFPSPAVTHRTVPADSGAVHLLVVAPSVLRPHAVAAGGGALRYPIRIGTTRDFLTEPEVADAYRRRASALEDLAAQSSRLHDEGIALLPSGEDKHGWSWLILTCVPDFRGDLELRRGRAEEWRDWVDPALREFPALGPRQVRNATVGYRRLAVHDGYELHGPPYSVGSELHLDGSGVLVFGYLGGRGAFGIPQGVSAVYEEHLLGDLVNGVGVLARHIVRAGATGTALIGAALVSYEPMMLAQYRATFPGEVHGTRQVAGNTPSSRHSVTPSTVSTAGVDLVAAVRLIFSDLVSSFGLAEPNQVTSRNELVRRMFHRDFQPGLDQWADAAGVTVVDVPDSG